VCVSAADAPTHPLLAPSCSASSPPHSCRFQVELPRFRCSCGEYYGINFSPCNLFHNSPSNPGYLFSLLTLEAFGATPNLSMDGAPAAAAAMASRGTHPHSASCPLAGYIKQLHALHKGFEFDGGIDLEPIRMDAFSGAYMEYCRVMHGNESPREWGWLASPLPHACFGATVRCSPGGGGRWVSDAPSCFHLTKHLPHRHA